MTDQHRDYLVSVLLIVNVASALFSPYLRGFL